jgi:hypothetical protein
LGIAWIVFRENVDRRIAAGAAGLSAGAVNLTIGFIRGAAVPARVSDR